MDRWRLRPWLSLLCSVVMCSLALTACRNASRWTNPATGIPSHPGGAPSIGFSTPRPPPPEEDEPDAAEEEEDETAPEIDTSESHDAGPRRETEESEADEEIDTSESHDAGTIPQTDENPY